MFAALTAGSGVHWLSSTIGSIFCFRTPPLAFHSSMASSAPSRVETPNVGTGPDRGARIVEVNHSTVDIVPEGYFLLISHMDKPGMIGKVGTVLGDTDINIASMEVARAKVRGPAMMILELDDDLPTPVLRKVREIKDLTSAISIKL